MSLTSLLIRFNTGFRSLFFPNFNFPSGTYNWGPTWFLNQLFFFSIIYAFAFGERWNQKIKCPSLLGFFIIGLVIGTFTGILLLFTDPEGDLFFAVPGFWANYLSYIPFFFGGAIAQKWVDDKYQEHVKSCHLPLGSIIRGTVLYTKHYFLRRW